jgi:transcriptional regulator of acetoin/glycerol metabolism
MENLQAAISHPGHLRTLELFQSRVFNHKSPAMSAINGSGVIAGAGIAGRNLRCCTATSLLRQNFHDINPLTKTRPKHRSQNQIATPNSGSRRD